MQHRFLSGDWRANRAPRRNAGNKIPFSNDRDPIREYVGDTGGMLQWILERRFIDDGVGIKG
jgi:hypothetical protein